MPNPRTGSGTVHEEIDQNAEVVDHTRLQKVFSSVQNGMLYYTSTLQAATSWTTSLDKLGTYSVSTSQNID